MNSHEDAVLKVCLLEVEEPPVFPSHRTSPAAADPPFQVGVEFVIKPAHVGVAESPSVTRTRRGRR
jgi:hypothetical protein